MDVNFSLALHNRTGKYHIGAAILEDQAARIGRTYVWRLPVSSPPEGVRAKLLGRALLAEQRVHLRAGLGRLKGHRTARPMLHLDPWTASYSDLSSRDVVLCHDLGPITHAELFAPEVARVYAHVFRYVAERQPRMVFVSKASEAAFVDNFGRVPRMHVIYPPIRSDFAARRGEPVAGIDRPFLLTVGSLGWRKNQLATIRAFVRSGLASQGFRYVLCGSHEPGADQIIEEAEAADGVVVLPFVSEAQLRWLYANASGFVLMSILEGFGLPVAEAIAFGLVPLLSRSSVLEEVAGPAALYADPLDEAEMAARMAQLAAMEEQESMRRKQALTSAIARFSRHRFKSEWASVMSGESDAYPRWEGGLETA